jgi:hypothetical protein
VLSCVQIGNKGRVWQMYNPAPMTPNLLDNNQPSIGLSDIQVSWINGVFECSFLRQREFSSVNHYFPMNQAYYLLIAKGAVSGGENDRIVVP